MTEPRGAAPSRRGRPWRWGMVLGGLLLLALGARLWLFAPGRNVSPDAIDYLNIARNLAEGRGFTHSIKWHFFTDAPVLRPAAGERPPLYPVLLAPVLAVGADYDHVKALNLVLGLLGLGLAFGLCRRIGQGPALGAGVVLLLALNPSVAKASVFPWTEPLYLALLAGALWLLLAGFEDGAARRLSRTGELGRGDGLDLAAGLCSALAYLARPSALALLGAAVLVLLLHRRWRSLGLYALAAACLLAPWFLVVWLQKGDPFYSVQGHHFQVRHISEGMAGGWGRDFPGAREFAAGHPAFQYIAESVGLYLRELFGRPFFGLLTLALPAGLLLLRRPAAQLLGLCGLLHFLLTAVVWATHEGDRLLQPTYLCWLPLALGGGLALGRRLGGASGRVLALLLALLVLGQALVHGRDLARSSEALRRGVALPVVSAEARRYLDQRLPEGLVLASNSPFLINWVFDRPTVQWPEAPDVASAERFLRHYGVGLVAIAGPPEDSLRALQAAGLLRPLGRHFGFGLRWYAPVVAEPAEGGASGAEKMRNLP